MLLVSGFIQTLVEHIKCSHHQTNYPEKIKQKHSRQHDVKTTSSL